MHCNAGSECVAHRLSILGPRLFLCASVALECTSNAGGCHSLTLNQASTVAWAFGQLHVRQPMFWQKLTEDLPPLRSPDGFAAPPALVIRLLWGMALAGHRNVAVLQSVSMWMNNGVQLRLCKDEHILPILRSFAMLQYSPGRVAHFSRTRD